MTSQTQKHSTSSGRLSRERVVEAAMAIADALGLAAVSMRRVARKLGVEAMSLYNHVADKNDLIDAMVDRVFAEIELPECRNWRDAMARHAHSMCEVLARHSWAVTVLDSRGSPGPATLGHHDWVIAVLTRNGFALSATAHACAVLDSFVYGFVIQEANLPDVPSGEMASVAEAILEQLPVEKYPHLARLTREHVLQPGYAFSDSFDFGLDLILDGLERHCDSSLGSL